MALAGANRWNNQPTLKGNTMQFEKFILPTHWAVYLVNSDPSYLDDDEISLIDAYVDDMLAAGYECFHVVDVDNESYFSRYHDADNGKYLLTEVSDYQIQTA